MATFVTTIKFTEQGIKTIQDSPRRAAAFNAAARKIGVKVTDIFWTMGAFDGLLIMEAPDAQAVAAVTLQLCAQGNVHTQTACAFSAADMEAIAGPAAK